MLHACCDACRTRMLHDVVRACDLTLHGDARARARARETFR